MRPSIRWLAISALVAFLTAVAGAAEAQSPADKKKAREHFEQAEMFMKTGVFDEAVGEYKKAYELAPKAHGFLFNIGLAYEKWGNKPEAVAAYSEYLNKQPDGKKAKEARARKIALERKIAAENKAAPDTGDDDGGGGGGDGDGDGDGGDNVASTDGTGEPGSGPGSDSDRTTDPIRDDIVKPAPTTPAPKGGVSWGRVAVGAAALVAGLVVDLAPDSSTNGSFDAVDLVPVGLYGASAFFLFTGVF